MWALAESEGSLYVGATNGLFWGNVSAFRAGGRLSRASVVQGSLPDDWVTALLRHEGALYVGTYNAGVTRFARVDGKLVPNGTPILGHVNPAGIVALSGADLAVCTMEGLWKGRTAAHTGDVTALVKTPRGYWLGTRQGVVLAPEV